MRAGSKLVVAVLGTTALVACRDGLIYSERTSIALASARINDDPATPVAIKLGFGRDVVAVAPPIGGTGAEIAAAKTDGGDSAGAGATPGGEAVSQFSTFSVNVGRPFVDVAAAATDQRQMWVHSRFASGGAALAIADDARVVGAMLGFTPLTRLSAEDLPLLGRLSACVNAMDQQQLNGLARTLDIFLSETEQRSEQQARQAITSRFLQSDHSQLEAFATRMPSC